MRTEFEKWAKTYQPKSLATSSGDAWKILEPSNSGGYRHAGVHYAWKGYQAGYQAATAEAEKYREALEKMIELTKNCNYEPIAISTTDE